MSKIKYLLLVLAISFNFANAGLLDIFSSKKEEKVQEVEVKKEIIKIEDLYDLTNNGRYSVLVNYDLNKVDIELMKDKIKILDFNGNEIDFTISINETLQKNKQNSFIYVSAEFIPEELYSFKLVEDIDIDEDTRFSFDISTSFSFKSVSLNKDSIILKSMITKENNGSLEFDFLKNKIKTKNIREYLKFSPNIEYTYRISDDKLTIFGDFKPNSDYSVNIEKGFVAGFKKSEYDINLTATFGDLNQSLAFKNHKSYISSYTEAIEIESVNIDSVDVTIFKINPENLNYLNIFDEYLLNDKYYIQRGLKDYSEIIDSYTKVLSKEKNKKISTLLDFKENIQYKDDGIYAITINSENGISDSKLVYKSDLGISAKVSKNQLFVLIRSLKDSETIRNTEIFIYSDKNRLITSGKTNSDGILMKNYENFSSAKPKLVIAKKDDQINFLNLKEAISDYDILNDYSKKENSEYKALVFMERTLLRPNDKANILITVKDKSFKSLKNENIYIKVFDPTSNVIIEDTLKLNDAGAAEYKYTSYNDNKTGKYRLSVFLGDEQIGSTEFYVEAFIPEKIEVNLESSKTKILSSQNIDFKIKSKYLIGIPAKNLKYDFEAIVKPSAYKSEKFKDYSFSDILNTQENLISQSINESGVLDEVGEKNYNINIPISKNSYSSLDANLITTVYDDGRPVRKYKNITIYPHKEIVGLKKLFEGDLKAKTENRFRAIVVDALTEQEINSTQKLDVRVFKKFWHYYAEDEIRELESFEVKSNEDIRFTPNQGGQYYISVTTASGQTTTLDFYVSWWGNEPSNLKDKSSYKVTLQTNKEVYNHGDIVSLNLKSPIKGRLLLTIEENEIIDYMVVDLDSNTASFDLIMPKEVKKGAYIKAHVVRPTKSSDEIFPYRVIGSTFIKKDNSKFNSNADISLEKLYTSNDEIKIKVKASNQDSSYAVISLVDKGILNIVDEKNIDAFAFFDKKEKSKISLYDLYSNLQQHLSLKAESVSGDGLTRKREKFNSPDAINERVKPVSFWSGIIKLDDNQEGEVSFKVKDFNGELRAQALVLDENTISSDTKYTIVKDDISIKPTLPRFFIQNDNVSVPVRLLNTTNIDKKIKLEIITTENLFSNISSKIFTISSNSSVVEMIQLKALKPGLSKIQFRVLTEDKDFSNETTILINDKYDYKVVSKFGILNENSTINLEVIDDEMKKLGVPVKAFLSVDNAPFSKLSKSYKYLIGYPYGCAEQTSSKILAMLYAEKFIDKNDIDSFKLREIYIKEGINKLVSMQKSNGYFSYWAGGEYVNNYASFYAMYTLQLAKSVGFDVPQNSLDRALRAHWSGFNANISDLDFFISYVDERTANKIYDNKEYGDTLTSYIALAVAMKRVGNISEYEGLIEEAKKKFYIYDIDKPRSYSGSFYSPLKDLASSLFLYKNFINKDPEDSLSKDLIKSVLTFIENDELYSTQDKAFAMLAVTTYYQNIDTSNSVIDVTSVYNNELKTISERTSKSITFDNSNSITLKNNGGIINYALDINKPIELPLNHLEDKDYQPIVIKTNYVDKDGNSIDVNNINLGQKFYIEVELFSDKRIENVATTIKIPSGLEILNKRLFKDGENSLKTEAYDPDYEDYRDDRFLTFLTVNTTVTKFYIPVTAVTKGIFVNPSSYIEAMYDSRINNYYKAHKTITIK